MLSKKGLLCVAVFLSAFLTVKVRAAVHENNTQGTVEVTQSTTQNQRNYDEDMEEVHMIPVTIKVGEQSFEAVLYDSESVRQLRSRLPLTITMNELNGNEKYYYFSESLPTASESIGTAHEGDLMLFGSDCLVLFYETFRTSYSYTRIGSLTNPQGLHKAVGNGSCVITIQE